MTTEYWQARRPGKELRMKKPFEDWSRDEMMALVAKAIISLVVGFLLGVMSKTVGH